MTIFNNNNKKELRDFLYNSCVHDANLNFFKYDCSQDSIKIELFNPIFNVKIYFTFLNIETILTIKGNLSENHETIVSLTLEDDFSYLHNYLLNHSEYEKEALYMLFQMFSGDELHIVSKEVIVEMIDVE